MFLNRVRVPNFRVLKDVDITFEKEFRRSIFPLGSQNGGGKSTLLQLIFVLLHCSTKEERWPFLQNMLSGFEIRENADKRVLAIFNIIDGGMNVELEFFVRQYSWIKTIMNAVKLEDYFNIKERFFGVEKYVMFSSIKKRLENYTREIETSNININENIYEGFFEEYNFMLSLVKHVNKYLEQKNLIYIIEDTFNIGFEDISNIDESKVDERKVVLCKFNNLEIAQAESFLKKVSDKIILAAPSTQVFLFFSGTNRKKLFEQNGDSYSSSILEARSQLSGLFTYDFLAINYVIEILRRAMNSDMVKVADTGEYGNSFQELLSEINLVLPNMKLSLRPDLSGVTFKIQTDNEVIEVEPEDLSHGELKRLSIYMWLKHNNIEDAIVLMDELENAFHPDWQSQIIRDLIEWTPTNQYIIATHSYELCEAVPPAYVKELEPKLLPRQ